MLELDRGTMDDIVQWDAVNWKRAIKSWDFEGFTYNKGLGIGEAKGGLSLLFSLLNDKSEIICSDYKYVGSESNIKARKLHEKYNVEKRIKYEDIDATHIPYENEFDVVFFKSVLGGIGCNNQDALISKTFKEIYKALKPGGRLYYVENLKGNLLVRTLRKKYSYAYRHGWNYLEENELIGLQGDFKIIKKTTLGCIACIGPNEKIRNILGKIDMISERVFKNHYIISCVLEKVE